MPGEAHATGRAPATGSDRHRRELEAYRRIEEIRRTTGTPHLSEGLAAGTLPDGSGFIALAYHEGGSLADRVKQAGPLPAAEAVAVAAQVLEALGHLHAAGLCHRDVKPGNVLLGADGRARLGDYGLATPADREISTGGTPAFAAPEQWSEAAAGVDSTIRSGVAIDVYGVGATLYYLLTGRPPLPGRPDLFALERARVPRPLQAAVLRALEVPPQERFASTVAFAGALRGASAAPAAPGRPKTQPISGRWFALGAGLALAVAVLLASPGSLLDDGGGGRPDRPPQIYRDGKSGGLSPSRPPQIDQGGKSEPPSATLSDPVVADVTLPDGRRALGTLSGRVLLVDPAAPPGTPPRELHAFGRALLSLRLDGDALVAEGDDRRPARLADGAPAPEGSVVVEGATGRFAYPREPVRRGVRLAVPAR